jgi:signal peptidase I
MNNKIIQVNGKILSYKTLTKNPHLSNNTTNSAIETMSDIKHYINIDNTASGNLSNFVPVTVTPGHYSVLGDNRRHNTDSRVYGFVPHHALRGKATVIVFSVNYNNYYLIKSECFLKAI